METSPTSTGSRDHGEGPTAGQANLIVEKIVVSLLLSAICLSCQEAMDEAADLVIRNARVYTLDSERPWVEAIAVERDRISYVGSDEGAEEYVGESTRVIDAEGRLVLPGFIDIEH